MKNYNVIFTAALLVLLTGCAGQQKLPAIGYVAVDLPTGTIQTQSNKETVRETHSRFTPGGLYRPPVKVADLLTGNADSSALHRDVDIVLQTPFCAPPLMCNGVDTVVYVAEQDKL